MDKQAREAREMTKQLKGKEKWKNFWYYYKYHTIAIIFSALLIFFSLTEFLNQTKYDLIVSCYTTTYINSSKTDLFVEEIEKNIGDVNANKEIDADVAINIADLNNPSEQTQAVFMKFSAEIAGGEAFGYILDETFYQMLAKDNSECIDTTIQIDDIPLIKEIFNPHENHKLYWITKSIYEPEKGNPQKISAHKNAVNFQEYLNSLKNK